MDIEITPSSPVTPPATPTTSVNDGQAITMPPVVAPSLPKVEGVDPVDRGDEAELEVLHHMVGEFLQGARILIADLPEAARVERLVKLGAVRLLKAAAKPEASAPQGDKAPKKPR